MRGNELQESSSQSEPTKFGRRAENSSSVETESESVELHRSGSGSGNGGKWYRPHHKSCELGFQAGDGERNVSKCVSRKARLKKGKGI